MGAQAMEEQKPLTNNGAQETHADWATLIASSRRHLTHCSLRVASSANQPERRAKNADRLCARGLRDGRSAHLRRNMRSRRSDSGSPSVLQVVAWLSLVESVCRRRFPDVRCRNRNPPSLRAQAIGWVASMTDIPDT